jgi:hypothetical protein
MPPPTSRYSLRAAADALRNRGNHSSGTERSWPSASRTCSALSVHRTSTARGSGLIAEVLIPSLLKEHLLLANDPVQLRELAAPKSHVVSQSGWGEPELSGTFRALYMNIRRFLHQRAKRARPFPYNRPGSSNARLDRVRIAPDVSAFRTGQTFVQSIAVRDQRVRGRGLDKCQAHRGAGYRCGLHLAAKRRHSRYRARRFCWRR